jgi:hypothetical protein
MTANQTKVLAPIADNWDMEVNPNIRAVGVSRTPAPSLVKLARTAPVNPVTFSDSEAVNRALQQTPDVRADRVAQATVLANDDQYPPLSTIRAIAHLLAGYLDDNQG